MHAGGTYNPMRLNSLIGDLSMSYRVLIVESDEGFSVSCPALRGCHSQGSTRQEALDNIRDAIREWLAAEGLEHETFKISEEEVHV